MGAGRSLRPRTTLLASIIGVAAMGSCADGPTEPATPVVASVEIAPVSDTLEALGATRQLSATARDAEGRAITGKSFTWSSAAPSVATVSESGGLVTAVGNGEATITASVDGVSGSTLMAVSQRVSTVVVSPASADFTTVGVNEQLAASASDANGSPIADVRFLWISSEPSVATVDSTGLVTARGPGSTVIAAAARGVPGYAGVTVTQVGARVAFSVHPTGTEAGAQISPAVQVEIRDAAGTLVEGSRAVVSLSAIDDGGAAVDLYGTATVNATSGIATISGLSVRSPTGTLRLVASSSGMASDTSDAFVVSPGPAASVSMPTPPPPTVEAGTTVSPAVEVTVADEYGNPIPGAEVTVSLSARPSAGHTVDGTLTRTAVGEVASFGDLVFGRPGSYALSAEVGSVASPASALRVTMTAAAVTVGQEFTCALAASDAYCWGRNESGTLGAATVGATDSLPLPVSGTEIFTELSAGADHACGLTGTGAIYCWGNNGFGQLGDGGFVNNVTTPTLVQGSGSGALVFTSVSAGLFHTCGLTTNQQAYCWGHNGSGQLGDSTIAQRNVPTRVAAGSTVFTRISAGASHTCAIDDADAAHCWGYNLEGQLGTGVADAGTSAPVPVAGGLAFSEVRAGSGYTCAIAAAFPGVYCWGYNGFGQLGDGTNTQRLEPWPALAGGVELSVGESHTCSIDTLGDAYCWGRNNRGQLGNGTSADSSTPTPVLGGRGWSDIGVGYWHTCAVSDGVVYCWGSNGRGELGDGTSAQRSQPVRVAG